MGANLERISIIPTRTRMQVQRMAAQVDTRCKCGTLRGNRLPSVIQIHSAALVLQPICPGIRARSELYLEALRHGLFIGKSHRIKAGAFR